MERILTIHHHRLIPSLPPLPLPSPQTQKFEHPALLINISLTLMCAIVHTFYGPSFDEWMDTDGR